LKESEWHQVDNVGAIIAFVDIILYMMAINDKGLEMVILYAILYFRYNKPQLYRGNLKAPIIGDLI
jgi:hypothetical protein